MRKPLFTGVLAMMIAFLLSLAGSLRATLRRRNRGYAVCLIASAVLLAGSAAAVRDVRAHGAAWLLQVQRIEAAAAAGEESVMVSSVPSVSPYTMSIALEADAAAWPNSTLTKYYGIHVIGE